MDPRWLSYLDAHIARGLVATEAESAETLSWLLKLEPEQRWCLLLRRDPCLKRLVADDYRRILSMMVELEADALAAAPTSSTEPCVDSGSGLSLASRTAMLPSPQEYASSIRRHSARSRMLSWGLAAALVGVVAGFWLLLQREGGRLETLARTAQSLQGEVDGRVAELDRMHRQTQADMREIETERQATQSLLILSSLSDQLAAGQPFVAELNALAGIWTEPGQLDFLKPLAERGIAKPETLISELARLNEQLEPRSAAGFNRFGPYGQTAFNPYAPYPTYATTNAAPSRGEAQRQAGATALAQARRGEWQAAIATLRQGGDPGYRDWTDRVERWLAIHGRLADLRQHIWSRGARRLAESAAQTPTSPPP